MILTPLKNRLKKEVPVLADETPTAVPTHIKVEITEVGGIIYKNELKAAEFGLKDRTKSSTTTHIVNVLKHLEISKVDEITGSSIDINKLNKLIESAQGFQFIDAKKSKLSVW